MVGDLIMKRKKIIIFAILAFLVILPIGVLAYDFVVQRISVVNYENLPDDEEKALKEKEEIAKQSENNENLIENNNISEQIEQDFISEEESKEVEETNNIILNVMNRYYPREFNNLIEQVNSKTAEERNVPLTESSPEIKVYDLILDVLETKSNELSDDEISVLKEFISSQYSEVKDFTNIRSRIENICGDLL